MTETSIRKHSSEQAIGSFFVSALYLVLGVATSTLLAFVGFDLTDEGLAVRGATEASQGHIFSSPFGVPLQFLWNLLGGDLRLYRLVFLLTLLVAAWLAASRVIEFVSTSPNEKFKAAWTAALAASSWSAFVAAGFPTPNYNSLTYLGALLTIIGLLGISQIVSSNKSKYLIRYILRLMNYSAVGLGISIAFYGKFSAAVILLVGLIVFVTMAGDLKQAIKQVLSSCLWAIFWFLMFSVDYGPSSVLDMIYRGAETVVLMDSTYSPLTSMWKFVTSSFPDFAIASFIMFSTLFFGYLRNGSRIHDRLAVLILLNLGVLVLFLAFAPTYKNRSISILLISLTFLAIIHYVEMRPQLNLATARVLVLCYSGVLASSIGGNNGFALVGVYSGLLVGLTIFLLSNVPFRERKVEINSVKLLSLISIFVLVGTITYPYRQPSLFLQSSPISIGGHTVLVDSARASEIKELRQCLVQSGLMGNITLDFTGNFTAGLIFALGNQSPKNLLGTVWGYDGSELLMQETIRGLPISESSTLLLFDSQHKEERLSAAERLTGSLRNSLKVVCSTSTWEIRRWN